MLLSMSIGVQILGFHFMLGLGNDRGPTSKTLSPEHRAKLSKTHKGTKRRPLSAETKAKISAANKGRQYPPVSDETRAKLSKILRGQKRRFLGVG